MKDTTKYLTTLVAGLALTALAGGALIASPEARTVDVTLGPPTPIPTAADEDIVEVAARAGTFETLLTAAKTAGLVETLKGEGPLTVFAPTDEAFAALPEGTVPALLEDEEKLRAVLTYHVVAGRVTAEQVVKLDRAETVNGQSLWIRVEDGTVRVNDATVVKADVMASNGVIHVIDEVLIPGSKKEDASGY